MTYNEVLSRRLERLRKITRNTLMRVENPGRGLERIYKTYDAGVPRILARPSLEKEISTQFYIQITKRTENINNRLLITPFYYTM